MVLVVPEILLILENWIEKFRSSLSQESDVSNDACYTSDREGTTRKPDENNLIARGIVCSDEAVDFPNILTDSGSEKTAADGVHCATTGTNSRMVIDDLRLAIKAHSPKSSRDSGYITGYLESACWNVRKESWLREAIVTEWELVLIVA